MESGGITLVRVFPELTFEHPVALIQMPHEDDRWFVVEVAGRVKTFSRMDSAEDAEVFVDISDRVASGGERGLLGMAFHPRFVENGYVYLSYTTDDEGRLVSRISRFVVDEKHLRIRPDPEAVILSLEQPHANHNGGNIVFGPDGYLYIGFGDGGSAGDPEANGQNMATLLGSILRIDVDGAVPYAIPPDNPFARNSSCASGGCPEIYAWGLRNPWRFSFDLATGRMWVGDVGQDRWEEVDLIERGGNYGWNIREGSRCFRTTDCPSVGLAAPAAEYPHDEGCSVTGGYVYRGNRLTDLDGIYIYGDYCSGKIWGLRPPAEGHKTELLATSTLAISSFGQGNDGEIYVLDFDGGGIYRVEGGSH